MPQDKVKCREFVNKLMSCRRLRHMKVVRLSALRTGCIYLQKIFLVLVCVRDLVDPRNIARPEGLGQ